jgi:hypothetical protein
MKHLSFLMLLSAAALLISSTTIAQNPHYNSGPCVSSDGRTITAVITGLGQGTITVQVTGDFDCVNPGDNEPPAWQDFNLSRDFAKKNGGNFNLSFTLSSLCNKKWTFRVQNLAITIYQNGTKVLGPTSVSTCN